MFPKAQSLPLVGICLQRGRIGTVAGLCRNRSVHLHVGEEPAIRRFLVSHGVAAEKDAGIVLYQLRQPNSRTCLTIVPPENSDWAPMWSASGFSLSSLVSWLLKSVTSEA